MMTIIHDLIALESGTLWIKLAGEKEQAQNVALNKRIKSKYGFFQT